MGTKVRAEQTSYVDGALAGCIMKVLIIWRRGLMLVLLII